MTKLTQKDKEQYEFIKGMVAGMLFSAVFVSVWVMMHSGVGGVI